MSLGLVTLMVVASLGGLAVPGMHRDNPFVTAGWQANEAVTLVLAIPALVWALTAAMHGSVRGSLVWMGLVWFTMYNYAFYLFGAAYNRLFLVYALLFTLSLATLVFGMISANAELNRRHVSHKGPGRWVALYMLLVGLCLAGLHLSMAVTYLLGGELPRIVVASGQPANIVAALDLSMVVPVYLLGAWWLWRGQRWGIVLGVIANVWGAACMAVVSAGTIWVVRSGVAYDLSPLALWVAIGVGCLVASGALLLSIKPGEGSPPDASMVVGI
jgi:hypothetical protein